MAFLSPKTTVSLGTAFAVFWFWSSLEKGQDMAIASVRADVFVHDKRLDNVKRHVEGVETESRIANVALQEKIGRLLESTARIEGELKHLRR